MLVSAAQLAGLLVLAATVMPCLSLDNGLALTPPMGFNTWNCFGLKIDEAAIREIADVLVDEGYLKAGYKFLNIDDGWSNNQRAADGSLEANSRRFASGIKTLADYAHNKGLKLGIYGDAGFLTCGGFPGSRHHEEADARAFADWGVDLLKYDNCWASKEDWVVDRYTAMRDALNATERPIVFSMCEWGVADPWLWAPKVGNSWRTTADIAPTWQDLLRCLDNNVGLARFAGPGKGWNDPDMLEVGNGKLTIPENQAHFALWAVVKAPLLIGTDIRVAPAGVRSILLAEEVIAINQDPLGIAGDLVWKQGSNEVYAAPLKGGGRAVVLFNRHHPEYRFNNMTVLWEALGYDSGTEATVRDLFKRSDIGKFTGSFTTEVEAHGVVALRISPTEPSSGHEGWRPWHRQPVAAAQGAQPNAGDVSGNLSKQMQSRQSDRLARAGSGVVIAATQS